MQWFSQWPLHLVGPYLLVNFPVSHSGTLGIENSANNALQCSVISQGTLCQPWTNCAHMLELFNMTSSLLLASFSGSFFFIFYFCCLCSKHAYSLHKPIWPGKQQLLSVYMNLLSNRKIYVMFPEKSVWGGRVWNISKFLYSNECCS